MHLLNIFSEDSRLDIIRVLGESSSPVSIAEMQKALVAKGHIDISFSTVARRFKDVEQLKLCYQIGQEGRVLTRLGHLSYQQLQENSRRGKILSEIRSISSTQGLEQLLRIRRAVEPEAAYEFASKATEDDIKLLKDIQNKYKTTISSGGPHPRGAALEFHRRLAQQTSNPFVRLVLDEALHPALDRVDTAMDIVLRQHHVHESSVEYHDAILEALFKRQADEAEQLMREHIDCMLVEFDDVHVEGNQNVLNKFLEWSKDSEDRILFWD